MKGGVHFRFPRFITNWKKLSQMRPFSGPTQTPPSLTGHPVQPLRAGSLGNGDSKQSSLLHPLVLENISPNFQGVVKYMGLKRNKSTATTMRNLCIVLLLLMMLLFAQTCLVDSRELRPETKTETNIPEAVDGREFDGKASFTANTADDTGVRVLVRDQVFHTMTSGPSTRGPGH